MMPWRADVTDSRRDVKLACRKETKAGVERIITGGIYEMKGDKIAYVHRGLSERTDPQTARFVEWQRAQPPAR